MVLYIKDGNKRRLNGRTHARTHAMTIAYNAKERRRGDDIHVASRGKRSTPVQCLSVCTSTYVLVSSKYSSKGQDKIQAIEHLGWYIYRNGIGGIKKSRKKKKLIISKAFCLIWQKKELDS